MRKQGDIILKRPMKSRGEYEIFKVKTEDYSVGSA